MFKKGDVVRVRGNPDTHGYRGLIKAVYPTKNRMNVLREGAEKASFVDCDKFMVKKLAAAGSKVAEAYVKEELAKADKKLTLLDEAAADMVDPSVPKVLWDSVTGVNVTYSKGPEINMLKLAKAENAEAVVAALMPEGSVGAKLPGATISHMLDADAKKVAEDVSS